MATNTQKSARSFERSAKALVDSIEIPFADNFVTDFITDDRLADLGSLLIEEFDELHLAVDVTILYLWRRRGGQSKGRLKLGACMKTSGLVYHFARKDFIIWLAADNLLTLRIRNRPVHLPALLYHELMHIGVTENGQPTTRGHEFEGFASEVDRFGIWRPDMREIARAFQESLFPEDLVTEQQN